MTDATTPRALEHDDFAGHVGTVFTVVDIDPPISLTLEEVRVGKHQAAEFRVPFTLYFTARDDRILAQQTLLLRHDGMGEIDLFLAPFATKDGVSEYEAVFN